MADSICSSLFKNYISQVSFLAPAHKPEEPKKPTNANQPSNRSFSRAEVQIKRKTAFKPE